MNRDVFFNAESNNNFINQVQNSLNEENLFNFYVNLENDSILGSFIGGKNKEGKNIKFLLSVEENQFYRRGNNSFNSVLEYKQELLNSKIQNIENKFNSYVSLKDNKQKIHDLIVKKKDDYKNFIDTLEYDYNFNIDVLEKNRLESIIFEEARTNEGFYFNNISNYFFSEMANYINIVGAFNNQDSFNLCEIKENEIKENSINIFTTKTLENNLIGISSKIYDINTCNDIIAQVLVNLSRSFYILSNNSLIGNYSEANSQKIVNEYNFERYKVLTSDRVSSNLLRLINPFTDSFDVFSLNNEVLNESSNFKKIDLEPVTESIFLSENIIQDFSNSKQFYLSINSDMNFLSSIKNFYTSDTWNDFTSPNSIFNSENDNPSNFTAEQNIELNFAKSLNKIFSINESSNLFSIRWNYEESFGPARYRLSEKYHDLIENDEVEDSFLFSPLKKFKEILQLQDENRLKLVFLNDKPIFNVNTNQSNVLFRNELLVDKNENLNDFYYKIKIDNLVKKLKRKNLKNKQISLELFKNLITRAKLYEFNKMVAYSNSDNVDSELSLINKESLSHKLLFTKDTENENIVYSNTDMYTNHSINNNNFLGCKDRIEREISKSQENVSIRNNIKKVINNYYPKNYFFSTSTLYGKIIQDIGIAIDTVYNDRNINVNNCNALYLNKFTTNNITETSNNVKKTIARRFLKKALFMSDKTPETFNKSRLSDYEYNYEAYDINDYKQRGQDGSIEFFSVESLNRYLNAILGSSPNLKILKDSVYSLENIESLKIGNDYTSISSINIYESDVWLGLPNESKEILIEGAIQKTNIFPLHSYTSRFQTFRSFDQDVKFKIEIEKKNRLIPEMGQSIPIPGIGQLPIPTGNYSLDTENIDITESKDIKIRYYIETELLKNDFLPESEKITNNSDTNNYIEVTDLFDKNAEELNSLFNNICKVIIEALNLYSEEFSDDSFLLESEDDIDSFISRNNSFLGNEVEKILNLYSDIYMELYKRVLRYASFYEISQSNFSYSTDLNISQLPTFGRVNKININSSIPSIIRDIWDLNNKTYVDFKESSSANNIIQNEESFTIDSNTPISSSLTKKLYNIQKSLFVSDFYQSYMFDLLNGSIFHQEKLENLSIDEIKYKFSNKEIYEKLIKEKDIEFISNNFFNNYYFSNLSKNLFENSYKSSKITSKVLEDFENQSLEAYSKNFFESFKDLKNKKFEKSRNISFSNFNLSEYYQGNFEDLDKVSSLYMFGLRNKDIANINESSLIKFTINIVDKLNLNHVYLPNVLYFSPNLFEINYIEENDLINVNSNSSLGFYTHFEDLLNKKKIVNTLDLINQDQTNIKNAIRQKITQEEEEVDLIYNYLIKCHVRNQKMKFYANFMLDVKEDYSNDKKDFKDLINNSLSNKEFYSIFNKQKKYIDNMDFDKSFEELSSYLDNIFNLSEVFKDLYEVFFISVNPKSFIFYDLSDEENSDLLSVEEISSEYLSIIKNEINDNFEQGRIKQHSGNSYLENISIDIKVEII